MSKEFTKEEIKKRYEQKKASGLVSFHFEGYELQEKMVKQSGNSGRIYLPHTWVGKRVKIVRMDPIDPDEM